MNEVRKLAGQTIIYGVGTIIPRFLNYAILTTFYTYVFEKEQYGVVTELYAWMALLLIVLTYGMETGFFRFSQKKEDYEKVYSTSLISLFTTSVVFIILVNIFIRPVAGFLKYSNNFDYIRMFSAIVAIDAFCAIPFARLRRDNRPIVFSVIKIANVIITIVAVVFLLKIAPGIYKNSTGWFRNIYDPDYGVGYVFLANLIGSSATMIMLIPFIARVKLKFYRETWNRMIVYSFPLLIAGLSGSINDVIDKILLRRLSGEGSGLAIVGEYGAGYKIAVLMALFIQMFRFAAEPFFFERARRENAKETYVTVMKYFVIVMLIIYMVLNLYISGIQYIIDKSYRSSMVVVPIVSMAYVLYGVYLNHSIWYKLNDLTRFGVYITLSGAFVTVIINLLFIPQFGYMASAWAHVASYGLMIVLSFIFARKYYPIDYKIGELLPYFLIAITSVIFAALYDYSNIWSELAVNTMLLIGFLGYAQYRDRIFSTFVKGNI